MKQKSLSVRMDEELLHKLHIAADYDGRSANMQIVFLIRRYVESFESRRGKLLVESNKEKVSKE